MMWSAYVVGTIIGVWAQCAPPPGWQDITGTQECRAHLALYSYQHPNAGDPPIYCLLKVQQEREGAPTS